jgi:hypothetical protein
MMAEESQFFKVTTDGMVGIEIENIGGKSSNFLYVEDLRKLLHDDFMSFPEESSFLLTQPPQS